MPSGKETLTISQGPHITQAMCSPVGPSERLRLWNGNHCCGMGSPWQEDDHKPTYRAAKPTHSCAPGRELVSSSWDLQELACCSHSVWEALNTDEPFPATSELWPSGLPACAHLNAVAPSSPHVYLLPVLQGLA